MDKLLSVPNEGSTFIAEQFLPCLIEEAFPTSIKHRRHISHISRPSERIRNTQRGGIWLIREPNTDIQDESGWYCIHWPSLLRRILTNTRTRNKLYALGYQECRALLPKGKTTPDEFFVQCAIFKRKFERYLPPGAAFWSYDDSFQRLINFIPIHEKAEDTITVFRAGSFLTTTTKKIEDRLNKYLAFNEIGQISEDVSSQLPDILRLLLDVLKQSDSTGGYEKWGLAWTNKGLIWHYGRALLSARQNPALHKKYLGDLFTAYLGVWAERYTLNWRIPFYKKRYLSSIAEINEVYCIKATDPYSSQIDNWDNKIDSIEYQTEYQLLFPLNKVENLSDYIFTLIEESKKLQVPNITVHKPHRINKRNRPNSRKVTFCYLNADAFGYYDGSALSEGAHLMGIQLLRHNKEFYVTYPDVITDAIPTLNVKKWFDRRNIFTYAEEHKPQASLNYRSSMPKWVDPDSGFVHTLDIPRTKLPKGQHATIHYKNQVYFNISLLQPDGEAIALVDKLAQYFPAGQNAETLAFIEAYRVFLKWLHTPELALKAGELGSEFETLVSPTSSCPIKLTTVASRLEYLWAKAQRAALPNLAYVDNSELSGTRSTHPNIYDKYVFWFASNHELLLLPYELNKKQQAAYIAKRWTWWRRADCMTPHLIPPPYSEQPVRLPKAPRDLDITELLEEAEKSFGVPFTAT